MKVLIADDDLISRMITKAAVEQAGHDCVVAVDGDEAWELYQVHQPGAVVTDLMMPGLNGLDLCRAIRESEDDSYTYLILVTSHGSRDDVLAGMEAGADDYVTKPLDPFNLRIRLLAAQRITSLHADLARYRSALTEQARTDPLTKLHNRLKLTEDLAGCRTGPSPTISAWRWWMWTTSRVTTICTGTLPVMRRWWPSPRRLPGRCGRPTAFTGLAARSSCCSCTGRTRTARRVSWSASVRRCTRCRSSTRVILTASSPSAPEWLPMPRGTVRAQSSFLKDADLALYAAKASGRNRVTVASRSSFPN